MKIDGHYNVQADVAWLRFEDYEPARVIAEELELGLREVDPVDRRVVGSSTGEPVRSSLPNSPGRF